MPNDRLRDAIRDGGYTVAAFADALGVDVKSVRRWISDERVPYQRHRIAVVALLREKLPALTEHEIWPDLETPPLTPAAHGDLTTIHLPSGERVKLPDWRDLAATATTRIDLLDLTLTDTITDEADCTLLAARAQAGATIRVLTSVRDSIFLTLLDEELNRPWPEDERQTPSMNDVDRVARLLAPLRAANLITMGTFVSQRALTMLRFDDRMLVSIHLNAVAGTEAPILDLNRHLDGGLFDRFTLHFDRLFQSAEPA